MNIYENENILSRFLINIYINIKGQTVNFNYFETLCNFIDLINNIIVTDIIFNHKRNYINFFSYLYFLNPILYFEIFNNYIIKDKKINITYTTSVLYNYLNYSNYEQDQISLIINKYIKLNIYDQNYFIDFNLEKILIIFLFLIISLILSLQIKFYFFKIIQKILSYILFLLFKPCLTLLLLLFLRKIFSQLSINYKSININIVFDFILFFLFLICIYYFYCLFIYAYNKNEKYYFFRSKIYFFEIYIHLCNSLILSIRLKIIYSITIQFLWFMLYLFKFYQRYKEFKNNFYRNISDNFDIFFDVFILIYFAIKFILFLLINKFKRKTFYKISEIIIIIIFSQLIFVFIRKINITNNISKLNEIFEEMKINFNYGIYQIFEPIYNIVLYNNNNNNFNEKNKKIIIELIDKNVLNNINKYEKNFKIIKEKLYLLNNLKQNNNEETYNINELYNNFFEFFSIFLNFFYNKLKYLKDSNSFIIKEILIYNKIILYWFIDKKSYKTEFLIKKFIYGKYFKNSNNLIMKCFFYYLNYKFIQLDSDKKKNFVFFEHVLYYMKINSKYLKINNAFKQIIKNYSRNLNSLYEISKSQINKLSKNLKKLRKLIISTKQSDIKHNEEIEKYKLIESILFTKDLSKISENFDFNIFDFLIENNIYFILLYQNNNFIIKKIPINFYDNTLIKSNLIKNKLFINLFPTIMHYYIKKQIKKAIFKNDINKTITVVKTYNDCIVLVKLKIFLLPSFQDKLYLNCNLKFLDDQNHNSLIIDEEGYIKYFGEFFIKYFGLNPKENDNDTNNSKKKTNIFYLLNKPNFNMNDFTDIKFKMFNISFDKFYQLIINNSKKYKQYNNKEFENNMFDLKNKYKDIKKIKIKLIQRNNFKSKNKKLYYILTLIMEDIIIKKKIFNKIKSQMFQSTIHEDKFALKRKESSNASIVFNEFIIQNDKKQNFFKNYLEIISFIYNFLLILIVLIIYSILREKIKNFEKVFSNIFSYRQFNNLYYYSQFYLIQKIRIKNENITNNEYDIYSEKLFNLDISLNLTELYFFHCNDESIYFLNAYNTDFKNNLKIIKSIKEINEKILEEFEIKDINGNNLNITYLTLFDEYLINNYILCSNEEFYVDLPIINEENKNMVKYLSDEQKTLYFNMVNYFNIFSYITQLNKISENHYQDAFNYLIKFTLLMIFLFVVLDFISIILSFISIKIIDVKIFKIIKEISLISKENIIFLKNKLKFTKKFINDEIKASKIINNFKTLKNTSIIADKTEINLKNSDIKTSFIKMQSEQFNIDKSNNYNISLDSHIPIVYKNTSLLNSPNLNLFHNKKQIKRNSIIKFDTINDYNEEENIIFNEKNSPKFHNDFYYIYKLTFLFYFGLISIIFGIFLPIIINYFNITKQFLTLITLNTDLQDIAFNYFFNIRLSIYFNKTKDNINIINLRDEFFYIFREHFLNLQKHSYFSELKEYLNGENACDYLVYDQQDYTDYIINACYSLNISNTLYYIITNGMIYDLHYLYINFFKSNRTEEDIIKYFHSDILQLMNLKYLINIMDGNYYLEEMFIFPNFNEKINKLSIIILQFFLCLVILEIINYYINHFFILKSSIDSYNIYLIINLFFFPKGNKKNLLTKK